MKDYLRTYPLFSLCGLNCGLCPRFHTEGSSQCPGCGGSDFYCKRGNCGIVSCAQKHGNIEYCFQCEVFPCERYIDRDKIGDSFITYKNVLNDLQKAKTLGIEAYKAELDEKVDILRFLLKNYNDGRKKNYYCLAVNLLDLTDLKEILNIINKNIVSSDLSQKEKIAKITALIDAKATDKQIVLKLRKEKSQKGS